MNFFLAALMLGLGFVSLGLGIYISMRIFNIPDITTDGSYTLGGVVTAVMLTQGFGVGISVITSMLAGALAGSITGFIHTRLKINALLAGILVMTALYSVNLTLMGRSNLPLINLPTVFNWVWFAEAESSKQLVFFIITAILLCGIISLLLKTDFGLAMRATGNSEPMIRALGVNTDAMKIAGLALSNSLVALSGCFIVQYQGFADINMGIGIVILGLGSVMIGETLTNALNVQSIVLRLLGVMLGTIAFRLILAFVLSKGVNPNLLKLFTAAIVLVVVALPNLKRKD